MEQTQVKLITVLGTGKYSETKYRLDSNHETVETRFFPVAVAKWFEPNEIYVLLTEQARNHENWQGCKENLAQFMSEEKIHEVSIPEGKSEEELWQIFDAITKVVQEGDEIILDITHGFRSLPLLAMLAVAYLRQVRGVSQVQILYGAYEAGNQRKSPQPEARQASPHKAPESETQQSQASPAFDLTPFVRLLDWLTAAKIFMETGDGRELARLIRTIPDLPQQQDDISTHLENLYTNLMLNRAQSIPDSLRQFTQSVEAISSTSLSGQAKPLAAILQHIIDTYQDINNPDESESEIQLILWYYERKHMLQAATLAAEFLTNLVIRATKEDRLCRKYARTAVSDTIERFLYPKKSSGENDQDLEDVRDFLKRFADAHPDVYEKYRSAWKEVREVRNDLSHCGYREQFADPDEVIEKLNRHFANLREIHDAMRNMQS